MSLKECFASFASLTAAGSCPAGPQTSANGAVDLLLLGSGWSSTFILPLAAEAGITTASTTRAGTDGTIAWEFDPDSDDFESFQRLPDASTVLIIFPIYSTEGVQRLVRGYLESRLARRRWAKRNSYYLDDSAEEPKGDGEDDDDLNTVDVSFMLLGSTGIYDNGPTLAPLGPPGWERSSEAHELHKSPRVPTKGPWVDESSPWQPVPRALAEETLLALTKSDNAVRSRPIPATVLLLCGLWGHGRSMRNFISRLPANPDVFRNLGSVHMIHGRDVGRAVRSVYQDFAKASGRRWILTNLRVYDMWDLASRFGSAGPPGRDHPPTGPYPGIVQELMKAHGSKGVRALPRSSQEMFEMNNSLSLDGRAFWSTFGLTPDSPWVE
ncbi:unnamed protein product [Parajaminaea phylloscopi]